MKVLIIKLSAFGDIIHSLSVIEWFRKYSEKTGKDIELHWLVEKKWSPILKNNPGVDEIIETNTKEWRKSPLSKQVRREVFSFWSSLRKTEYDLVIDINGLLRSVILARLSRAHLRIGFSEDSDFIREKYSSRFLDRTFSVPSGHVVDQTLGLLRGALSDEISGDANPILPMDETAARKAGMVLAEKDLIANEFAVITAGGGWDTKLLDVDLIAEFCERVSQHGITPVLVSYGNDEKKRAEKISNILTCNAKYLENLEVDILIEVLRKARLVVGPDTGVIHAASAVETPSVSYYGPSSGAYSGPRRPTDRVVQISPECGPCFKRKCDNNLCSRLDISMVLDEIDNQLD